MKMTFGMRVLSSLFVVVFMFTVGVDEALAYPGECTICVDNSVPEIILLNLKDSSTPLFILDTIKMIVMLRSIGMRSMH